MVLDPLAFTGTERFVVERCLGSGGFGTVYQAYDRLRRAPVALKILHHADPASLLALKREFRSLADLSHPNLVSLYELLTEKDLWFITMEHIKGSEFVGYIDGATPTPATDTRAVAAETRTVTERLTAADTVVAPRPLRQPLTPVNLERLEVALRQLAAGLTYLHGEGRLHRDIKPSNVLVTEEGRVVLLDFGLVTELESFSSGAQVDFAGTPAYMAPLRATGPPFTPADDWYSVGVMLFESLTGTLPFTGSPYEILQAKSADDAPSPRALVPSVPAHIDQLCAGLLSREPARRLDAAATLMRDPRGAVPKAVASAVPRSRIPLVGRAAHLEALNQAYRDSGSGQAVTVYVHGSSGMGKTALVRAFLRSLPSEAVILSGRCFERESVPYKALDSVVDGLSDYLRGLASAQVKEVLPADVLALARVFPVLRRIEAVDRAKHRVLEIPDALELRRRAFAAFRELMRRLAQQHPVALFIDDLQWGDEDSAALLAELLRQPNAPLFLLIATYRSEEVNSSAALRRLLPANQDAGPTVRFVAVTELTTDESKELTAMLQSRGTAAAMPADAVLREAGGNPFLLTQLVQHAHHRGTPSVALTLDEVIHDRVMALPAPPRRLLEILSVFGQPLDQEVANQRPASNRARWRPCRCCERNTSRAFVCGTSAKNSRPITIGFARRWSRTCRRNRCAITIARSRIRSCRYPIRIPKSCRCTCSARAMTFERPATRWLPPTARPTSWRSTVRPGCIVSPSIWIPPWPVTSGARSKSSSGMRSPAPVEADRQRPRIWPPRPQPPIRATSSSCAGARPNNNCAAVRSMTGSTPSAACWRPSACR